VKSGKTEVSGFLSNDKIEFNVPIYRSGLGDSDVEVTIEVDPSILGAYTNSEGQAMALLPSDKYVLDNSNIKFSGDTRSAMSKLTVDIKSLHSIQEILDDKHAIPLVIKTKGAKASEKRSELVVVPVLTGGIRPGSEEVVWSKTFTELGVNPTDHFTASLGVTSKYVYVNTRAEDLKYYDRFTGEYKGKIELPFKGSLTNFTVANDESDNLLITNLRNAAGIAQQTIYRIINGGAPSVFINIAHEYPNGRKLSILGDLTKDALITSTVERSSNILVWTVRNGQVVSQTPTVIVLDATKIFWANFGDAIPLSQNINDGFFAVGNGNITNFGYFNGAGQMLGKLDLGQFPYPAGNNTVSQSLAGFTFNGARYLALATQSSPALTYGTIVDVSKYRVLDKIPTSSLIVYNTQPIATTANANMTTDIQVRVSEDQKSFIMYVLGTNGSISATKFTD